MRRRIPLILLLALIAAGIALGSRLSGPSRPFPPLLPPPPGETVPPIAGTPPHGTLPVDFVSTGEGTLPPATAEIGIAAGTAELPVTVPPREPPKPPEPPEPDEEELPEHPPKRIDGFKPPRGFRRIEQPAGSFARFVQTLPLKGNREIRTYTGKELAPWSFDTLAVVDLPLLFKQDLEQCADFAMRLFAEWHKARGTLDRFHLYDYPGNRRPFKGSGKSYQEFLRSAFSNSNSHSLKKGLSAVKPADLRPGDLIVQNETGGIGHVSVIFDMCENGKGKRRYLIGFSFMPAQEMHLERARPPHGRAGWFTLKGFYDYLEARFPFGQPVLRRFSATGGGR